MFSSTPKNFSFFVVRKFYEFPQPQKFFIFVIPEIHQNSMNFWAAKLKILQALISFNSKFFEFGVQKNATDFSSIPP